MGLSARPDVSGADYSSEPLHPAVQIVTHPSGDGRPSSVTGRYENRPRPGILRVVRRAAPAVAVCAMWLTASACAGPMEPSPDTVDVLEFLIGDAALWPRHGEPNHYQHQIVDGAARRISWTKYTLPWSFETWRWDEEFVYHEVDHAIDGRRWEHYTFSDGRWLPRRLPRGQPWRLDLPANRIRYFDAECVAQPERPFPYRVAAWLEAAADAGGDLGVREQLVLEYQPYDPANPTAGSAERFYFARGAGWFKWSRGDGAQVTFNRLGGVARQPTPWCERDSR